MATNGITSRRARFKRGVRRPQRRVAGTSPRRSNLGNAPRTRVGLRQPAANQPITAAASEQRRKRPAADDGGSGFRPAADPPTPNPLTNAPRWPEPTAVPRRTTRPWQPARTDDQERRAERERQRRIETGQQLRATRGRRILTNPTVAEEIREHFRLDEPNQIRAQYHYRTRSHTRNARRKAFLVGYAIGSGPDTAQHVTFGTPHWSVSLIGVMLGLALRNSEFVLKRALDQDVQMMLAGEDPLERRPVGRFNVGRQNLASLTQFLSATDAGRPISGVAILYATYAVIGAVIGAPMLASGHLAEFGTAFRESLTHWYMPYLAGTAAGMRYLLPRWSDRSHWPHTIHEWLEDSVNWFGNMSGHALRFFDPLQNSVMRQVFRIAGIQAELTGIHERGVRFTGLLTFMPFIPKFSREELEGVDGITPERASGPATPLREIWAAILKSGASWQLMATSMLSATWAAISGSVKRHLARTESTNHLSTLEVLAVLSNITDGRPPFFSPAMGAWLRLGKTLRQACRGTADNFKILGGEGVAQELSRRLLDLQEVIEDGPDYPGKPANLNLKQFDDVVLTGIDQLKAIRAEIELSERRELDRLLEAARATPRVRLTRVQRGVMVAGLVGTLAGCTSSVAQESSPSFEDTTSGTSQVRIDEQPLYGQTDRIEAEARQQVRAQIAETESLATKEIGEAEDLTVRTFKLTPTTEIGDARSYQLDLAQAVAAAIDAERSPDAIVDLADIYQWSTNVKHAGGSGDRLADAASDFRDGEISAAELRGIAQSELAGAEHRAELGL